MIPMAEGTRSETSLEAIVGARWRSTDDFQEGLLDAVRAAGREILKHYEAYRVSREGVVVSRKQDDSPLTAADLASHGVLEATLQDVLPGVPVLSEEGFPISGSVRDTWDAYWLVDPLDGTKEFLDQNGQFTVNVALVVRGEPAVGAVHAPALETTYLGIPGVGAWRFDESGSEDADPTRIDIRAREHDGGILRAVVSRSHLDGVTLDFLARLAERDGTTVERVEVGSGLKLCQVAEGAAHIYPRFGPTMWWDIAAGHAVLAAAGGAVRRLDGTPLVYRGESLVNPPFIASGGPRFPWADMLQDLDRDPGVPARD